MGKEIKLKKNGKPQYGEVKAREFSPGLYLVATPIGNLRDITLRALDVLRAADVIYCEDTRVTGKLLSAQGIKNRLQIYNDHSGETQREKIIAALEEGRCVALVSDAGSPLISDPGFKLVRECAARGIYVTALPGACAPVLALQLSGLPTDRFCFLGFLPPKSMARRKMLTEWKTAPGSLVVFETASRLLSSLADIGEVLGGREIVVTRELTKMFEEVRRGGASELISHYENHGLPKGEIVLVIAPPVPGEVNEEDVRKLLRQALKDLKTKEAAAKVAEETGLPRKMVYEIALQEVRGKM